METDGTKEVNGELMEIIEKDQTDLLIYRLPLRGIWTIKKVSPI
jgi:hypothetical protein